eukprot:1159016-Pelagomonas_calceolata.AAC.9
MTHTHTLSLARSQAEASLSSRLAASAAEVASLTSRLAEAAAEVEAKARGHAEREAKLRSELVRCLQVRVIRICRGANLHIFCNPANARGHTEHGVKSLLRAHAMPAGHRGGSCIAHSSVSMHWHAQISRDEGMDGKACSDVPAKELPRIARRLGS